MKNTEKWYLVIYLLTVGKHAYNDKDNNAILESSENSDNM